MTQKIKVEISVGLTEQIKSALEMASEFTGTTPSQYGRQAILEKLIREQFMQHPGIAHFQNNNHQKAQTAEV
jgi:hypothetical protein